MIFCRIRTVVDMRTTKIVPEKWYTPSQAGPLLDIGPETVKKHCRAGTLKAKRVGAKKRWMIPGTAIIKQRKEWQLDGVER